MDRSFVLKPQNYNGIVHRFKDYLMTAAALVVQNQVWKVAKAELLNRDLDVSNFLFLISDCSNSIMNLQRLRSVYRDLMQRSVHKDQG